MNTFLKFYLKCIYMGTLLVAAGFYAFGGFIALPLPWGLASLLLAPVVFYLLQMEIVVPPNLSNNNIPDHLDDP